MNRIICSLAASALLAATSAAQAPTVVISSIPPRPANDPVRVVVLGNNFGIVSDVRVNGVSVPITRVTAGRLVVSPVPPQVPGFGTVELVSGVGVTTGTIEFTPTLRAQRRGMRVTSTLRNGEEGAFVLRYAYAHLGAPVAEPEIYYGRLLPADAGVLGMGVFLDGEPIQLVARLPIEIGMIGAPLDLQALCVVGANGFQSYTNLASVAGLGQHQ